MENKPIVAFDESGNTGSDMLDISQPVFVLSSVLYTEEEAKELLSCLRTNSPNELKFKNLRKNAKYWKDVATFLNQPLIQQERISIVGVHKGYSIAAHTVDKLIEEVMHRQGVDLYDKGANQGMTNLLFYTMPVFASSELWEEYKIDFVNMFRNGAESDISRFYTTVKRMIDHCKDEQFKGILVAILASRKYIKAIFAGWNKYGFDPALTSLVNLADRWGQRLGTNFDVYFDESKPIRFLEEFIDILKSPELDETKLGYDRRILHLPLKIAELSYKDSTQSARVQVADIIAGAAAHYLKKFLDPKNKDGLADIISSSSLPDFLDCLVWPQPAVTPEELHTTGENYGSLNKGTAHIIGVSRRIKKDK